MLGSRDSFVNMARTDMARTDTDGHMARTTGRTGEVSGVNESTPRRSQRCTKPHCYGIASCTLAPLVVKLGHDRRRKVGRYHHWSRTVYGCTA